MANKTSISKITNVKRHSSGRTIKLQVLLNSRSTFLETVAQCLMGM